MVDRPIKKADRLTKVEGLEAVPLEAETHMSADPEQASGQALEPMGESTGEPVSDSASDSMVERISEKSADPTSENPRKAPPVKLKDRSEVSVVRDPDKTVARNPRKSSEKNSEGKEDGRSSDRAPGFNPNAKVISAKEKANERGSDRGNDRGDRSRRNSRDEEPRQVANLALLRGPRPTKPKVEEPPAEVEALEPSDLSVDAMTEAVDTETNSEAE